MLTHSRLSNLRALAPSPFEASIWAVLAAALALNLHPFLSSALVSGWDTTSLLFLSERMLSHLSRFHLSGYNPFWFAGQADGGLYPPLSLVALQLPHLLSFGLVSPVLSLNLVLFALPFAFLVALRFTAVAVAGRDGAPWALVAGGLFLFLPPTWNFIFSTAGIPALTKLGALPSFLGFVLFTLFWGAIHLSADRRSRESFWAAALLFALIIPTDLSAALYTALFAAIFALLNRRAILRVLGALGAGTAISSWYLIQLAPNLWMSSASGSMYAMKADPASLLLPGLDSGSLRDFGRALESGSLSEIFTKLPLSGVLWVGALLLGLSAVDDRRRLKTLAIFLFVSLIVPRFLPLEIAGIPLRPNHIVPPMFLFAVLVAALGMRRLAGILANRSRRASQAAGAALLACLCLLTLVQFPQLETGAHFPKRAPLSESPEYRDGVSVLEFLSREVKGERVAVENSLDMGRGLGTPHFFSALLPSLYRIGVLDGLTIEQSLSAGYLNPLLYFESEHLRWGWTGMLEVPWYRTIGLHGAIARMAMYRARWIIAASERYARALAREPGVTLAVRLGRYSVFKILSIPPPVETTRYRPFLFVEAGGIGFRDFAARWFATTPLLDYPVVYDPAPEGVIGDSRLGGIIVSVDPSARLAPQEVAAWRARAEQVIFLGSSAPPEAPVSPSVRYVPDGRSVQGYRALASILAELGENEAKRWAAGISLNEPDRLVFMSLGGALINSSYAPGWRPSNPAQRVLLAAPSRMFVLGDGVVELRYAH